MRNWKPFLFPVAVAVALAVVGRLPVREPNHWDPATLYKSWNPLNDTTPGIMLHSRQDTTSDSAFYASFRRWIVSVPMVDLPLNTVALIPLDSTTTAKAREGGITVRIGDDPEEPWGVRESFKLMMEIMVTVIGLFGAAYGLYFYRDKPNVSTRCWALIILIVGYWLH